MFFSQPYKISCTITIIALGQNNQPDIQEINIALGQK